MVSRILVKYDEVRFNCMLVCHCIWGVVVSIEFVFCSDESSGADLLTMSFEGPLRGPHKSNMPAKITCSIARIQESRQIKTNNTTPTTTTNYTRVSTSHRIARASCRK